MVDLSEKRLTVDGFLVWAEGREGKWEPMDGSPRAMSPERVRHTQTKTEAAFALREAARRAGASCRAFVDGITLRISDDRAFVPDAVVVCPPPPPDVVEIDNPLIVVEVLSPSTAALDHGVKLEGYFSLAISSSTPTAGSSSITLAVAAALSRRASSTPAHCG